MAVRSTSERMSPLNAKNVSSPTRASAFFIAPAVPERLLLVRDLDAHPATGGFLHGFLERLGQIRGQQDGFVDPMRWKRSKT